MWLKLSLLLMPKQMFHAADDDEKDRAFFSREYRKTVKAVDADAMRLIFGAHAKLSGIRSGEFGKQHGR